uniref:Stalled ribosome sensor GCN1-like HEAT repeats region domain-containing protein n=1 Tax=Zooxanthella nutricula TaxID=1333877 RepID=A0A7S2NNA1_9DINO
MLEAPTPGETTAPLVQAIPEVIKVLQGLANPQSEEMLKDTLEILAQAIEAEAEFFKRSGCLKELSETLVQLASVGAEAFSMEEIRHSAMEALMSLAEKLIEDVAQPPGLVLLEALVQLNVQWMQEVEEDVDVWTTEGKDMDDDDCDDDVVGIGEENLDRLAEELDDKFSDESDDIIMPIVFKAIRAAMQRPDATWKTARSAIMALAQVVEYVDSEDWVDQVVEFVIQQLTHAHPRVRYAAFWAIGQVCYDQSPHVQEKYHGELLPAIVVGIDDANIRVATEAVSAFSALGEELDCDDLEDCMDDLLMRMFNHLHAGESQMMQEHCLSGIAVIAKAGDELFTPYYGRVMPMLKKVIQSCTKDEQRSLQGKAFECCALIGVAVGKERFMADVGEIMEAMLSVVKDGFAADDPRRDAFFEATQDIARTTGKDFKPFAGRVVPSIFTVLKQDVAETAKDDLLLEDDSDDDYNDLLDDDNLQTFGLKTSVVEEMLEALDLLNTLLEALEEEFCDFMPMTCENLLTMLDRGLPDSLRQKLFKTWEYLAGCARTAVAGGRLDTGSLRQLVTEFLKKTVGAMLTAAGKADTLTEDISTQLQAQSAGLAGVVRKAGEGVLTKEGVKDIVTVIVQMLDKLPCDKDTPTEPGLNRRRGAPAPEEDSDGEEREVKDETPISAQSVRFSLCDVAGALMQANRDDFCEVALPTFMEMVKSLVRPERSEGDRCLGFYLADSVVGCLADKSVPYWNGFMNEALAGMLDASPVVRQFAASAIGNGSTQAVFGPVAPAAATQVHKVLCKQGERHRRRRAVQLGSVQMALAVDTCIRALGQICEHHGQQLGADQGAAWSLWLQNLPIKYNLEAGKAAHAQLVDLVSRNHPMLATPQMMPRILAVFADIYKSKFSGEELDTRIAQAVASLGEGPLKELCSSVPETKQRKVEQMLKTARAGA